MFYSWMESGNYTLSNYCVSGLQKTYKKSCWKRKSHYYLRYIYKNYKKSENWDWKDKKSFGASWSGRVRKGKARIAIYKKL